MKMGYSFSLVCWPRVENIVVGQSPQSLHKDYEINSYNASRKTELPFPILQQIIKAYKFWEATSFPAPSYRIGISAAVVDWIFPLKMLLEYVFNTRDAAMVVFSFTLSRLRDYAVANLLNRMVTYSSSLFSLRMRYRIGKIKDLEPLLSSYRIGHDISSPFDLFCLWEEKWTGTDEFLDWNASVLQFKMVPLLEHWIAAYKLLANPFWLVAAFLIIPFALGPILHRGFMDVPL